MCGLYMVLWGKGKETNNIKKLIPSLNLHEIVVKSPTEDIDNRDEVEFGTDYDHSTINQQLQVK